MQYTENYYGALPRMDDNKGLDTQVRNSPARIAGVNYTNDETLWGYLPILSAWQGKLLNDYQCQSGLIDQMIESFERGDDMGSPREPIGIDREHAIYDEGSADDMKYYGYIVDLRKYTGEVATYTSAGAKVTKEVPENAEFLMAKIAWLPDGLELVKAGSSPFPSVVFSDDNGNITMGKPTITSNPADTYLPALVVCSKKEKELMMDELEAIKAQIIELLGTMDLPTLQGLLAQLQGAPAAETPPPAETAASETLSKEDIAELKGLLTALKEVKATQDKDEAIIAATEEMLNAGFLPKVATENAQAFKGMKPDNAVKCAKNWIARNPAPVMGSQVTNVMPITFEDQYKKFVKEGKPTLEATRLARETLKGVE